MSWYRYMQDRAEAEVGQGKVGDLYHCKFCGTDKTAIGCFKDKEAPQGVSAVCHTCFQDRGWLAGKMISAGWKHTGT